MSDLASIRATLRERYEQERSFADSLEERKLEFDMQPLWIACESAPSDSSSVAPGRLYVPFEVMETIFSFLPHTSILSSVVYVSKGWYLMSSTNFIWEHLYRHRFSKIHLVDQEGLVDTTWRYSFLLRLESEARWKKGSVATSGAYGVALEEVRRGVSKRAAGARGRRFDEMEAYVKVISAVGMDSSRIVGYDLTGSLIVLDKNSMSAKKFSKEQILRRHDGSAPTEGEAEGESDLSDLDGEDLDSDDTDSGDEGPPAVVPADTEEIDFEQYGLPEDDAPADPMGGTRLGTREKVEGEEDGYLPPTGGAERERRERRRRRRRRRARRQRDADAVAVDPMMIRGMGENMYRGIVCLKDPIVALALPSYVALINSKTGNQCCPPVMIESQILKILAKENLVVVMAADRVAGFRVRITKTHDVDAPKVSFRHAATFRLDSVKHFGGRRVLPGHYQGLWTATAIGNDDRMFYCVVELENAGLCLLSLDFRLGICVQIVPLGSARGSRRGRRMPYMPPGMPGMPPGIAMPGMPHAFGGGGYDEEDDGEDLDPGAVPAAQAQMDATHQAGMVYAVRIFRKNGHTYAHMLRDTELQSWDLTTGKLVRALADENSPFRQGLQFVNWDADRLIGFAGNNVTICNGNTGKLIRNVEHNLAGGNVHCVIADDLSLVVGTSGGAIIKHFYGAKEIYWASLKAGSVLVDESDEEEEEGEDEEAGEIGED